MRGGAVIREARRRAGISQDELSRRLGTSQSTVARWENGHQSPRFETVGRALRACGFDLTIGILPADDQTEKSFDEHLALSVDQRVDRLLTTLRLERVLQEAGRAGPVV
jgi:transcriptional regulator with XRE-family HTH domain